MKEVGGRSFMSLLGLPFGDVTLGNQCETPHVGGMQSYEVKRARFDSAFHSNLHGANNPVNTRRITPSHTRVEMCEF